MVSKGPKVTPKTVESLAQQQLWYSGFDVTTDPGRRQCQKQLIPELLVGVDRGKSVPMEIPRLLNAAKSELEKLHVAQKKVQ